MSEKLSETLKLIIMYHLSKLEEYVPAHGRGQSSLSVTEVRQAFAADPVYSIFGLDSPEYIAAALAGGTITSIHRKIGDAYEHCTGAIFCTQYNLAMEQVQYSAMIASGDTPMKRSLDAYLKLNDLPHKWQDAWKDYTSSQLKQISPTPKMEVEAVGFEVRHCYQSADSKRVQADEAMARHFLVSGILPVMLIFCEQSNRSVVSRYRSLWVVTEGHASYELLKTHTGFDFFAFLAANKEMFRDVVIGVLRRLQTG
ncbi:MAG: hypothetical protein ACUVWR_10085 [Anaerolineae bacterium]